MVYNLNGEKSLEELKSKPITLVTGIANAQPLVEYLKSEGLNFEHLNFKDHHEFSENDIQNLKSKQFILTTEKDYVRLQPHFANDDQLYYLPIETQIDNDLQFQELIKNYLK